MADCRIAVANSLLDPLEVGTAMKKLNVEYRRVGELKPNPRNPRTHSKKQIRQIARSIRRFGFNNPVLIDAEDTIVAGHGRVEAAKLLGMDTVPTVRLEHMTEAQMRAYVLADNKLAENAGWDQELLAIELQYLTEFDIHFDVSITGFEAAEIDLVIESLDADEDSSADQIPEIEDSGPPTSRLGDLWILGRHRLFCGDATRPETFERLMAGKKAQMVFTDPPYNVAIDGNVCGSGAIKHDEFVMASGEMSEEEYTVFLGTTFGHLARHSVDGSIPYVCIDWRHLGELLKAGRGAYRELKNLCVWVKSNAGMGSLYRSQHELIAVFKNGAGSHINNVELGRHGRNRANVWHYPGVNSLRAGRLEELRMHPTVKPVALVADAIKDCSKRRGIVLDCFAGSGTTLIAAQKTGRRAYAMELDPKYVDVTIRRWRDYVSEDAVHAESGLSFTEVQKMRANNAEATALGTEPSEPPGAPANDEAIDAR